MAHKNKIATIFGGTGFLGKQVVKELAKRGIIIKVATRFPESVYSLKTYGAIGQIVAIPCDYSNASSISEAIKGSDYVINCLGILFEKGKKAKFQQLHVDIPAMIAKSCSDEDVEKFIHISALGCNKSTSKYGKSKHAGEKAVLTNFPDATILRPSVIFGENDNFFNMFAQISRFTPILPLIGGGHTRFQPIYVGDVSDVITKILLSKNNNYKGKIYQLGGNDIVTFKEIYEKLFKYTGRKRKLIYLPFFIAKMEAMFLNLLPNPILTPDQVESLKTDNIVDDGALDLKIFHIKPKSMDLILPQYLGTYKSGGRFAK